MKLSVKDLTARYSSSNGPVYAVEDVDFDLEDGQSIGIAGESACGKSTLGLSIIRMLAGGKVQGKIILGNESILDLSESEFNQKFRWKKISMVFQGAMNTLDPVFTIKDQFIEVLKQHNFQGDFQKTIEDAMTSVSLDTSVLKRFPHELSGGMKQRVVIAMALLLKPQFVIADE
ncbi:MAG: ATP-binding cassette domain-containing protein, partial [Candidatus Nitrosomaritimum yanchengensis]